MSTYKTGDRVTAHGYGAGTVLRSQDKHRAVVQFDNHNGFHGTAPLIVWNYRLRAIKCESAPTDGYGSNYRPWERRPMATVTLDKI